MGVLVGDGLLVSAAHFRQSAGMTLKALQLPLAAGRLVQALDTTSSSRPSVRAWQLALDLRARRCPSWTVRCGFDGLRDLVAGTT
jgi:hypothetical protein